MLAVLLVATSLVPAESVACTTFLMDGNAGPLVGKSYDWRTTEGLILINKAGIKKSA
ncbi:MAG: penicillin V acylase-like amidase (Ntn superfamily), partial [Myxococcota bacterium]